MGKVISITNQKGGVAKTTTAIELSTGLARQYKNKKILLIDLDSQCNATGVILNRTKVPREETVFSVFQAKKPESIQIKETHLANLSMIASTLELVEVESLLLNAIDGFFRLRDALENVKKEFECIIIDCPPSLSVITINAMVAADYLIIPLQASKFSIDGIQSIVDSVSTIKKRYNPNLKIMGGVFTMFDKRTSLSQAMIPEIKKRLPLLETIIPKSVVVEEAHLLKKDLYDYSPSHKVTQAYRDLCREAASAIGF
ncbi:MAG: ParA family protein [Spirochaetia bacterium]|nr:ParA family protein [Spirochaetia bacterium]